MADPQHGFWHEVTQFLSKAFIYLFYISIGVIAKLAFEAQTIIMTNRQKIITVILSVFAGYLAAAICEWQNAQNVAKVVVPVATLLGDSLVKYIITNWKSFIPGTWLKGIKK